MIINNKKLCPSCGEEKDISLFYLSPKRSDGYRAFCKKCELNRRRAKYVYYRNYMKKRNENEEQKIKNRKYHKSYRLGSLEKEKAHQEVAKALLNGKLKRMPCEVCGILKSDAHHYLGYEKEHWLDIKWLCRRHHALEDRSKEYS